MPQLSSPSCPRVRASLLGGLALALALAGPTDATAGLLLNEYNAVAPDQWLNGGGAGADEDGGQAADLELGRVQGNGGDWFELVVTRPGLDLRGFRLELYQAGAVVPDVVLTFSQHLLLSELRAGTILTIAEDRATDASYDPDAGDWWIQLQSTAGGDATYLSQSAFDVSNFDWQLRILDAGGTPVYGPAGEGVSPAGGVGAQDVFRLEEDPSELITGDSACYDDGSRVSSFGRPNVWSAGTKTQSFEALRGGGPPTSQCDATDLSDQAFEPDRLLEIAITMAPGDWDTVRGAYRRLLATFGGNCGERPPASPFEFLPGDISIDGVAIPNVGIRKKGFFGSIDRARPSLRIKFAEYVPGQSWSSLDRITLNNSKQDPSFLDQCLGYDLFRAAGLPAPRCNFARVSVNGDDLGLYVHVESIKDPFLARNFGDASGNLYEGAISDFRDQHFLTFEAKNGGDLADLALLRDALDAPDEELLAALAPYIDLDRFLRYWAMEGLIGHWDSFSGNANNFWIYNDPVSGRFEFIPWSLDDIFGRGNPFSDTGADLAHAPSVFDRSRLVHRLWGLPQIQTAYLIEIQDLLGGVFDETALLAEIDRMQALIEPVTGDLTAEIAPTRDWIASRAQNVVLDFSASPPARLGTPLGDRFCLERNGRVHAEFETDWGTLTSPNPESEGSLDIAFTGNPPLEANLAGVTAGSSEVSGQPVMRFLVVDLSPFQVINLSVETHPELFRVGGPFPAEDSLFNPISFILDPGGTPTPVTIGYVTDPVLSLTDATAAPGGTVAGVLDAGLAYWVPAPEPGADLLAGFAVAALAALRAGRRRHGRSDRTR